MMYPLLAFIHNHIKRGKPKEKVLQETTKEKRNALQTNQAVFLVHHETKGNKIMIVILQVKSRATIDRGKKTSPAPTASDIITTGTNVDSCMVASRSWW